MSTPTDTIYVCHVCDLVVERVPLSEGQCTTCPRCHTVLETKKRDSYDQGFATAVSGLVLAIAASALPVLGMEGAGVKRDVSAIETAWALAGSGVWLLSILAIAMVVLVPILRYAILVLVFLSMRGSRPVPPLIARLFRISAQLRPWAMAEVFLIGVVVSLVKLGDLVTINIGLSFWALIALMLISVLEHHTICVSTVWQALDPEAT
ncbi:MAG: paraquat-inducible protein A [Myxococcota bacterium]